MRVPEAIKKFVEVFSGLPGIGPRQATRLAFYFIRQGLAAQLDVARAIANFKNIKICSQCFFIHENQSSLCDICGDNQRNERIVAIVEKETDLLSIEKTKKFNGRYLVLGDLKKTGILEAEQKLRLQSLKSWILKQPGGVIDELVVALNPNPLGDVVASFLSGELKGLVKKVTRLGRGIPTGGEIEFADEATLEEALTRRG
ncbi:MAG: recombination protein RecR [Candidatus Colwellbacteria bacterium]|nr:recombination protein RecR [Candidatus Colwellbacteria bacterium]